MIYLDRDDPRYEETKILIDKFSNKELLGDILEGYEKSLLRYCIFSEIKVQPFLFIFFTYNKEFFKYFERIKKESKISVMSELKTPKPIDFVEIVTIVN